MRGLADRGRIVLRRQLRNCGYPATANAGIRAAGERDAILLNSDTLVPPGWIERLAAAAYSAADIGTATPLSNDATVFSYPREDGANPFPDEVATLRLDRLARRASGSAVVEVPTAHGFCVYLRRDCLRQVGLLREDLFAQGYGEETISVSAPAISAGAMSRCPACSWRMPAPVRSAAPRRNSWRAICRS